MPRDSGGNYSLPNGYLAVTGDTIQASQHNSPLEDIASALTASLPVDGSKGMTGAFKAADGTAAAPSITFGSDTNTGLFRKAADTLGFTQGGTELVLGFPSGTVMLFQQTAAPPGWTKSLNHNNKALRIVTGTASAGGTTAFTSVFAARTISQANLPAVNFNLSATASATIGGIGAFGVPAGTPAAAQVTNSGTFPVFQTNQFGSIGVTVSGTAASGGSGTAMDFAVQYVDVIAAIKD